jgi:NADH-quinone oxidoreductase subunit H
MKEWWLGTILYICISQAWPNMIAFLIFLPLLLLYVVAANYIERKIAAFIQDRLGPYEVGPKGLFQPIADFIKLVQKEDIVPAQADAWLYRLAPVVIFVAMFAGFSVMPITPTIVGSAASVGVFYLLAIASIDVVGIVMAGWGSNNKYSLYGAMRSAAQIVSYEVPLGLSVLCVVMACQSLDLQEICYQQGIWINTHALHAQSHNYLFGIASLGIDVTASGGFLAWNIVRMPPLIIAFVIFFIASLAEANRAPFDLPEAESEIIGGFHTEYTGFPWAIIMLGEYGVMLLASLLGAVLFFGGWNTALPNIGDWKLAEYTSGTPGSMASHLWGAFWLLSKTASLIFLQMLARWTYPRLRADQLMSLCWKYLTPIILITAAICAGWVFLG